MNNNTRMSGSKKQLCVELSPESTSFNIPFFMLEANSTNVKLMDSVASRTCYVNNPDYLNSTFDNLYMLMDDDQYDDKFGEFLIYFGVAIVVWLLVCVNV